MCYLFGIWYFLRQYRTLISITTPKRTKNGGIAISNRPGTPTFFHTITKEITEKMAVIAHILVTSSLVIPIDDMTILST